MSEDGSRVESAAPSEDAASARQSDVASSKRSSRSKKSRRSRASDAGTEKSGRSRRSKASKASKASKSSRVSVPDADGADAEEAVPSPVEDAAGVEETADAGVTDADADVGAQDPGFDDAGGGSGDQAPANSGGAGGAGGMAVGGGDRARARKVRVIPFEISNTLPKPHRPRALRPLLLAGASPGPVYDVPGAFDRLNPAASRATFAPPGFSFGTAARKAPAILGGSGPSPGPAYLETKWRKPLGAAHFGTAGRWDEQRISDRLANAGGEFAGPGAFARSVVRPPSLRGGALPKASREPPRLGRETDHAAEIMQEVAARALAECPTANARPAFVSNGPFDPTRTATFGSKGAAAGAALHVPSSAPGPGAYKTDAALRHTRRSTTRGAKLTTSNPRPGIVAPPASTFAGPGAYDVRVDATRPRARAAIAYLTS
eukprot:TRINITY_DN22153_c0_g1_i1.p2 TRINITY_DN22153_c0_g1~~TRINITY_DN22153_c0_g1_i1.p2  ORF type:complete len:432 (-),score=67.55 TRINITY_DN22153_c0_g1_i1:613-1908(-)